MLDYGPLPWAFMALVNPSPFYVINVTPQISGVFFFFFFLPLYEVYRSREISISTQCLCHTCVSVVLVSHLVTKQCRAPLWRHRTLCRNMGDPMSWNTLSRPKIYSVMKQFQATLSRHQILCRDIKSLDLGQTLSQHKSTLSLQETLGLDKTLSQHNNALSQHRIPCQG